MKRSPLAVVLLVLALGASACGTSTAALEAQAREKQDAALENGQVVGPDGAVVLGPEGSVPGAVPGATGPAGSATGAGPGVAGPGAVGEVGGVPGAIGGGVPGAPAAGSPGSAPGAPGAPGQAAGVDGRRLPPLRIGFVIIDTAGVSAVTGSNNAAFGNSEGNNDAAVREVKALVAHANATGGIGGRRLEAVPVKVGATTNESQRQDVCVQMTEDLKLDAVIDANAIFIHESGWSCFARHKTPLVGLVTGTDRRFLSGTRPYVSTTWASLDPSMVAMVDGLQSAGYFKGAKLGVLVQDLPGVQRAYNRHFKAGLKRYGVEIVDEVAVSGTDPSAQSSQASNAVLRFKSKGVTHVVILTSIVPYLAFTNQAESQQYRPRYGFGDYNAGTGVAAFYGSAEQNRDALGVSTSDSIIYNDNSRGPTNTTADIDRNKINPGARRCLDIMSAQTKRDYYRPSQSGPSTATVFYCDHFFLYLQAARNVGAQVTGSTFGNGLAAIGRSYMSAVQHSTDFVPGRSDGAASFRVGKYDARCKCFVGVMPWQPLRQPQ